MKINKTLKTTMVSCDYLYNIIQHHLHSQDMTCCQLQISKLTNPTCDLFVAISVEADRHVNGFFTTKDKTKLLK